MVRRYGNGEGNLRNGMSPVRLEQDKSGGPVRALCPPIAMRAGEEDVDDDGAAPQGFRRQGRAGRMPRNSLLLAAIPSNPSLGAATDGGRDVCSGARG